MALFRLSTLSVCLVLAACASTGTPAGGDASTWAAGSDVQFTGRLSAVDTAPWAYDGNARLTVDSPAHGAVVVELPARWNLCKATGIDTAAKLAVGTPVRVNARVQEDRTVVVCASAAHGVTPAP